ncbi:MAG: stage II sporulation protein M [Anaerolineae bacterium]|nr:stage II sporulation protein M [Anaerolineae bacterium]
MGNDTAPTWRENLRLALIVAWREIQDVLRDWRLVVPILILTLFFPVLANFTAGAIMDFLNRYGGALIGERMVPFLLMIVGFFPISFSLVIALETFVGEKERKSLEPLLASPLSDAQLYLGKTLAATIVPLSASYLGITVYLVALAIFQGWTIPFPLLVQVVALTTAEAVVMVSGAVIISTQTTSVRAANLLASFVIIPMALLVQGESVIMFWARYDALWGILLFLLVGNALLIRMGLHLLNREQLLGREIDKMRVGQLWRTFREEWRWEWWLFGRAPDAVPRGLRWLGKPVALYARELPSIIRRSRLPFLVVLASAIGAFFIGWKFALQYPLPPDTLFLGGTLDETSNLLIGGLEALPSPWAILGLNLRALIVTSLLGAFSFGTLAVSTVMVTLAIIVYLGFHVVWAGNDPFTYFLVLVAPHGVIEIPAAMLASALGVRLGATFAAPPAGKMVGDAWLQALADFLKTLLFVVLPMLIAAAWIEYAITPQLALQFYGG